MDFWEKLKTGWNRKETVVADIVELGELGFDQYFDTITKNERRLARESFAARLTSPVTSEQLQKLLTKRYEFDILRSKEGELYIVSGQEGETHIYPRPFVPEVILHTEPPHKGLFGRFGKAEPKYNVPSISDVYSIDNDVFANPADALPAYYVANEVGMCEYTAPARNPNTGEAIDYSDPQRADLRDMAYSWIVTKGKQIASIAEQNRQFAEESDVVIRQTEWKAEDTTTLEAMLAHINGAQIQ